jgi:hypothetical protein
VSAIVAEVALALSVDRVDVVFDAAVFAEGQLPARDALSDPILLVLEPIVDFAGLGRERVDDEGGGAERTEKDVTEDCVLDHRSVPLGSCAVRTVK